MQVELNNQVAIVTGGAHGIGQAIAHSLAANGARVVIVDLDGMAGEQAARELSASRGTGMAVTGDVSVPEQMGKVVEQVMDRFGRIDILVNNAGINTRSDRVPIHEYSLEDWHGILNVDLTGV